MSTDYNDYLAARSLEQLTRIDTSRTWGRFSFSAPATQTLPREGPLQPRTEQGVRCHLKSRDGWKKVEVREQLDEEVISEQALSPRKIRELVQSDPGAMLTYAVRYQLVKTVQTTDHRTGVVKVEGHYEEV